MVLLIFSGLLIGGFIAVRNAQQAAIRSRTLGQLNFLRFALSVYEDTHGSVPPRELRDSQGKPTLSWLTMVLPHVEEQELFDKLNRGERWDSPHNIEVIRAARGFHEWYTRDGYFVCPWDDEDSIWNPNTGLPQGKMEAYPQAVLLIAIPKEGVNPFQPYTVSRNELRTLLEDQQKVLFINCQGEYGEVILEQGEIMF